MEVTKTDIEGLLILKPRIFEDERGYFFESYNTNVFKGLGVNNEFLQDNESASKKNVLRGLHFQSPPFAQGKLVRVISGSVVDIAVDIRKNSPNYGKHFSIELSADNKIIFWIPPGFAHGFVSLEDNSIFSYKCTQVYNKDSEQCLLWNDPVLNIDWGVNDPLVSSKDQIGLNFKDFISPF